MGRVSGRARAESSASRAASPARSCSSHPVQRHQELAGVRPRGDVGAPVEAQLRRREVGGHQPGPAWDGPPVPEPEVERDAAGQHQVGLTQRLGAAVAEVERMGASEQAAGHPGEEDRRPDRLERRGHQLRLPQAGHGLAPHQDDRPRGPAERLRRERHGRPGDPLPWRWRRGVGQRRRRAELPPEVPGQVAPERPGGQPRAPPGLPGVPLAHQRLRVQEIDRRLDEDRPRHPLPRHPAGALELAPQRRQRGGRGGPFGDRPHEGQLVDVLERASPPQHGGRGAAQQHQRRLGELGVLDGGEGVGDARPGRDRHRAEGAGEPRQGIGREDGARLVADIHHPQAARLGAGQDGRDVAAAEREEVGHAVARQDPGHQVAAVAHADQHGRPRSPVEGPPPLPPAAPVVPR